MAFKNNPEVAATIAKLADYFAGLADGEEVMWIRVEADTSIKMTTVGRALVRRALRRLKRPYEALHGNGVRLSSPQTAMAITRGKFCRIDSAVRVAERTNEQLSGRHLAQMSPDEQRKMLMAASLFGAIRAVAKQNSPPILKD